MRDGLENQIPERGNETEKVVVGITGSQHTEVAHQTHHQRRENGHTLRITLIVLEEDLARLIQDLHLNLIVYLRDGNPDGISRQLTSNDSIVVNEIGEPPASMTMTDITDHPDGTIIEMIT